MYISFFSCYMFRPIFLAIIRHMFVLYNCTYLHYYYLCLYVILSIHSICYIVSTLHELFFHRARWLGVLVRVRMWSLLLIGVCVLLVFQCEHVLPPVWVWLFSTCWVLLDLCVCIQILVSWDSYLLLMCLCVGVILLTY
jgi:hypothetical protein